ncbi:hypothetical protein [Leptospirillum ferriphilum]|uniref:hypothetical protein n=1 Tax=Leptospirillum ferriphilum TaxID=178606 RepID=UPI0006B1D2BD|nr:hypothetical protein [Leptospirillum ferriphilum]
MIIDRRCGHRESIPTPESKKEFLMEQKLLCKKCRNFRNSRNSMAIKSSDRREFIIRPMAMAMDLWGE